MYPQSTPWLTLQLFLQFTPLFIPWLRPNLPHWCTPDPKTKPTPWIPYLIIISPLIHFLLKISLTFLLGIPLSLSYTLLILWYRHLDPSIKYLLIVYHAPVGSSGSFLLINIPEVINYDRHLHQKNNIYRGWIILQVIHPHRSNGISTKRNVPCQHKSNKYIVSPISKIQKTFRHKSQKCSTILHQLQSVHLSTVFLPGGRRLFILVIIQIHLHCSTSFSEYTIQI